MLLTLAFAAQITDLATFLSMGKEYEANPFVLAIDTQWLIFGKLLLAGSISWISAALLTEGKYFNIMLFLLGFGFVMGSIGTISNTLVLIALEIANVH